MSGGDLHISIDDGDPTERPSTKHGPSEARVSASELARVAAEREHYRRAALSERELAMMNGAAAERAVADAAERDQQAAFEAGDSVKFTEAQRRIARAEARAVQFDEARANAEAQQRTFSGAVTSDPVEAAIAKASPRAQAWLREHRSYVTDPKLSMKASAAHNMAMSEGYTPDSDAYFDFCEKFLGLREGGSARSRPQNTALEDGARVLHVNPDGPLPPGSVRLSRREFELATGGALVWETGPKRGQPLGVREYLRRRQLQQGPDWQRLD